ncbi:MAG: AAA family ATPase, partial [Chromatiales bacterium]|nr:AAA family ATPase [Chromatiales bacterium]
MDTRAPGLEITDEFARALKGMEQGRRHLLITGSAGTGKSTLLGHFCQSVDWDPVVLAPTGVAALNVGGQTVHRFFGFGIDVTPQAIAARRGKPRNAKLYRNLRTLIIDEVSMLRADLLDCVDLFLRRYGPSPNARFGGVHMVFIGDLYQLPPVVTGLEHEALRQVYESPHFFSARALEDVELEIVELTRVFRQRDREFVRLLNRVRKKSLEDSDLERLNRRVDPHFDPPDGEGYITLTGTNRKAGLINRSRLDGLATAEHRFDAVIEGVFGREYYPTEAQLRFKAGAQVMLLNNDGAGRWVNGSIGVIEGVKIGGGEAYVLVRLADSERRVRVEPYEWELIRFEARDGSIVSSPAGTFTQFPFRLA